MIVVYPFSPLDQDLALKNAIWMNELGGCKGHDCLMLFDARCQQTPLILEELKKCFDNVHNLPAKAAIDGWPAGANYFFRTATSWLDYANKWPCFLWMEPDAIPLRPGWLDTIAEEYTKVGRKFMGDRVQVENVPLHMSGVGIYPNPLHAYAGEAYRAHETAWDMAGKDQIVPQAHFTELIEHAWKHPTFGNMSELDTQISKATVIFHSSKDGSLIKFLRARKEGDQHGMEHTQIHGSSHVSGVSNVANTDGGGRAEDRSAAPDSSGKAAVAAAAVQPSASQPDTGADGVKQTAPKVQSPGASICDIFIRTYKHDYPWLYECLRSINKFARGFRKIWIISPDEGSTQLGIVMQTLGYEWKQQNEETEDGYLAQQIHKLYADVITNYEADYILHIDSDTLFTRPVTPQDFFYQDRVMWLYTPYDHTKTPWKPITEKFIGGPVDNEFMRRFPIMVPKWLYGKLREHCYSVHKIPLGDYIKIQPLREFSEFNALGAVAWNDHRDKFAWVNTLGDEFPLIPPCARQFFSYAGITPEVRSEIDKILDGADQPVREAASSRPETDTQVQPAATPCPAPPKPLFDMMEAILSLKKFAAQSPNARQRVMQNLRAQGLTPKKRR